jgi:Fe-S cluster biogenesis protein NfuA
MITSIEVDEGAKAKIVKLCREIIAPILKADGGELYIGSFDGDEVHIFLTGSCSGCPGSALTAESIILPALRSAVPKVRVVVTTGLTAPAGAQRCA